MNSNAGYMPYVLDTSFECKLLTTHIDDLQQIGYTTYGICITEKDSRVLYHYPDISTDPEYVRNFLKLLTSRDVAMIHVPDLLDDYLE